MGVPQLAGDENLLPRHSAVLDTLSNLVLIAIDQGRVDMTIAFFQSEGDSRADLSRLRLPGTYGSLARYEIELKRTTYRALQPGSWPRY